ncbi:MAG: hypothetical protein P8183_04510 [Anaerolineae bacterium]
MLGLGAWRELRRLRDEDERRELVPPRVDFDPDVRLRVLVLRLLERASDLRPLLVFRLVLVFFFAIAQMFLWAL